MMGKKKVEPSLTEEEYREWLSHQEIIQRDGTTYIIVDGVEYPAGLEPNPALTGKDLRIAQEKEKVWMWSIRLGLLGIVVILFLVFFFSATA